jgi:A/G-specific adenine glycosylase
LRQKVLESSATMSRDLPWSHTTNAWAIVVSEFMLQQTSVARVREPWERFLALYPSAASCAQAPLSDVLRAWSGLGYPRRARNLHLSAQMIVRDFGGLVPQSVDELLLLPGVGPYTARAVASFAFNVPVGVVDTNTGRVMARCVAGRTLSAREAQDLADQFVAPQQSARCNQAMLDLGATYCRASANCAPCPVRELCKWHQRGGNDPALKSAGVSRAQARFAGSDRQLRGFLMRTLHDGALSIDDVVQRSAPDERNRVIRLVDDLVNDGLLSERGSMIALAD